MFDVFKAVILGIIEGFTEFLPISSTGHLILANQFITFSGNFAKTFDIVIQLGAILSVVVLFRRKLIPFGAGYTKRETSEVLNLWKKIIVGVIPTILVAATVWDTVEGALFKPMVVAGALIVGGIVILLVEKKNLGVRKFRTVGQIDYKTAIFIGLIQCLAIVPGTSRSASTIIGAILLGASRTAAAEFSFFLAIPTMVAASGYTLLKTGLSLTLPQVGLLAVGFIVSFIVALLVVAAFMKIVSKSGFKPFGVYRIVLGVIVFAYFIFK